VSEPRHSMGRPAQPHLWTYAVCCAALGLLAALGPNVTLRSVGALPLALLGPGTALCMAGRSRPWTYGDLALVPALSIAISTILGVALALVGLFDRTALAITLAAASLLIAIACRSRTTSTASRATRAVGPTAPVLVIAAVVVAAITASALTLAVRSSQHHSTQASDVALSAYQANGQLVVGLSADTSRTGPLVVRVTRGAVVLGEFHATASSGTTAFHWSAPLEADSGAVLVSVASDAHTLRTLTIP
jgi:multisubunit Na+/H+ antiporter MnhC subunit